jgi:YD repeat-containing protein
VDLLSGDSLLHTTRLEHDRRGRRIVLEEPRGASPFRQTFAFNPFDELERFVDADGSITTYERDILGRVLRMLNPDGETRFVWDVAAKGRGLGQLAYSYSPHGVVVSHGYDSLARPAEDV